MKVSLKELIETGCFGPVRLGMNREEVESSLGAPDDVGGTSRKYRKPSIWKYGDIELHFVLRADSLFLIHLDGFDVPTGGKSINLDPWVIRGTLALSDAEQHLSRSGIEYKVEESELTGKYLTAGAGVRLIFSEENSFLEAMSYRTNAS